MCLVGQNILMSCGKMQTNLLTNPIHRILPWLLRNSVVLSFCLVAKSCPALCGLTDCVLPMFSSVAAAAAAKSLQSCLTLCDPIDGSPTGSPIPGILQARTLEWVAISFSNVWKWKVKVKSFSRVRLLATPWTAAYQAPPSMGFSRQEYWSGVPLPSPMFSSRSFIVSRLTFRSLSVLTVIRAM